MGFKPGDKVRCVDAFDTLFLTEGKVYTVEKVTQALQKESVTLEEVSGGWFAYRFEKVEESPRDMCRGCSPIAEPECPSVCPPYSPPPDGTKHDSNKPRTDLLPPDALLGAAEVFRFGAAKYGERNWEKGIKNSRLIGSALRHLFSVMKGDLIDSESGLPHIDHALCCVMMLSDNFKNRKEMCNG